MKTCLSTVIYKQAKPYLQDLLKSVENQTDKAFDLLIINDNYTAQELAELQLPETAKVVDLYGKGYSIAQTRIQMLRATKELGYELTILIDADDMLSASRVAQYNEALKMDKNALFFYNKFVTETGEDVFKSLPATVEDIRDISQQNFLGLSNTGIRVDKLSDEFLDSLEEGNINVFDWYLFSRILMDIGCGRYVDNADTIYRIYEDNTAGQSRDLEKEYEVKKAHYSALSNRYPYFKYMQEQLLKLDVNQLKHSNNHQGYWWSDIQMEDSYEI